MTHPDLIGALARERQADLLAAAERGRLARQAARGRSHAAPKASGTIPRRHRRGRIVVPVNPTPVRRVGTAIAANRGKRAPTSPSAPAPEQSLDLRA